MWVLYAEHIKMWILSATGSLLPVLSGRTAGQASSGAQTVSVFFNSTSCCGYSWACLDAALQVQGVGCENFLQRYHLRRQALLT
jgi:hypothetical protein